MSGLVAFCIGAVLLLAPEACAAQQRSTFATPPPATAPPLADRASAAARCTASRAVSCAAAIPAGPDCAEMEAAFCDPGVRRISPYPVVVVYTFVGAVVGGAALAGAGYGLGSLGEEGGDAWITAREAFAVVGFIIGYPIGGSIGAVRSARGAGLAPHTGTVVLASFLSAAAGGLTAVGVARKAPAGVSTLLAAAIHAFLTAGAAVETGR